MKVNHLTLIHLIVVVQVCHSEVRVTVLIYINHSNALAIDVYLLHCNRTPVANLNIPETYNTHIVIFLCQFIPRNRL